MSHGDDPSWDEARSSAGLSFSALTLEEIPLDGAVGRVLAAVTHSLCDLPAYETSAMDGWVLCGDGPWKIVGEVLTGNVAHGPLSPGCAMKIATGGIIPAGGQSVLRWERAEERDNYIYGVTTHGEDIRARAMESAHGEILIESGTLLTPAMIGLIAASGNDSVVVTCTPRAELILLGDELMHAGIPRAGRVRDSLGIAILALLHQFGVAAKNKSYLEDNLDAVIVALTAAIEENDFVITTGGTADGPRDHIHGAIAHMNGELIVDRVKARPGHPMLLARLINSKGRAVPLLGLPGNPQSAIVAMYTLGLPLIYSLQGRVIPKLNTVTLAVDMRAPAGFTRVVAGTLEGNTFFPSEYLGSAMLRGLAHSTGFGILGGGVTPSGSLISWLPLS